MTNRRSVTHHTCDRTPVCFYCSWGPRANQLLLLYNIHMTFRTSLPNLAKAPVSANTDRTPMAIEPSTQMRLKLGLRRHHAVSELVVADFLQKYLPSDIPYPADHSSVSDVFHGVQLDQGEPAMYDPLVSILSKLFQSQF